MVLPVAPTMVVALICVSKIKFRMGEIARNIVIIYAALVALQFAVGVLYTSLMFHSIMTNVVLIGLLTLIAYRKNVILSTSAFFATFILIFNHASGAVINAWGPLNHASEWSTDVVGMNIRNILQTIVCILLAYVSGRIFQKGFTVFDERSRKTFSAILFMVSVFALITFFILVALQANVMPRGQLVAHYIQGTFAVNIAFVLVLSVLMIWAITIGLTMWFNFRKKDEDIKNLRKDTEHLESISLEARTFRHDHENLMLGFREHIQNNDINGIRKYYEKYMTTFYESVANINKSLDMLGNIKSPELKSILSHKIPSAQRAGIKIITEVSENMKPIPCEHLIDVCRVVSILFDNAAEACKETEEPTLLFGAFNKGPATLIIIKNTFATPPDMDKICEAGYTTKGEGRGIGLHTVSNTISKNPNLSLVMNIKDDYFVHVLSILP